MTEATRKAVLLTWDLDTWDEIANALGVSTRTARRWAELDDDPLPVSRMDDTGRARARSAQVQAWLNRRFPEPKGSHG